MSRRLVKLLFVSLVLAGCVVAGGLVWIKQWAELKIVVPTDAVVDYKAGTGLSALAHQLAAAGIVSSPELFSIWVRSTGNYKHYQAGAYRFSNSIAPLDIANAMLKGDVYAPVVLQIAVPEGFRMRDVTTRLAANGVGHIVEISNLCRDKAFLKALHVEAASLEGYLYPATYSFQKMPTPQQALEAMVKSFWQHLPRDYESRVKALGLTLNQAVIFASLIELETRTEEEKPLISEVIWRRLNAGMALGIDAALIYGIADYHGDLTWANLADAKNPYNTRIHRGLPPSPIGSPDVKSLEAVLIPSNFGYYYYVLIAGESRHHFSKSLAEHNLHVKKLVNAPKRDKIAKDRP